jgi:hypothetical protein
MRTVISVLSVMASILLGAPMLNGQNTELNLMPQPVELSVGRGRSVEQGRVISGKKKLFFHPTLVTCHSPLLTALSSSRAVTKKNPS